MIREVLLGGISGLAATAPMTGAMPWGHRRLPRRERYPLPPRQVTMKLAHKVGIADELGAKQRTAFTAVAHFGYGAAMGSIYGALFGRRCANAATGVLFGAAVWTGSYLGLLPALGILTPATRHPLRRNLLMIGAHLVWGVALGESLRKMGGK